MKKSMILLFSFALTIILSQASFAMEKPRLEDAIHILQVLSGYTSPPGFDATGTWAVQSLQNGEVRKGEVLLQMLPDGNVTGYAELTSLPGLSTVSGIIHGLTFDLHLKSEYGAMTVSGTANAQGDTISGSFLLKDTATEVFWDGHKQTTQTISGTYQHDTEENILSLNLETGGVLKFTIYEFTDTVLSVNCFANKCTIWERKSGEAGSLEGVWINNQMEGAEQIITFYNDGTFSNIQKVTGK